MSRNLGHSICCELITRDMDDDAEFYGTMVG